MEGKAEMFDGRHGLVMIIDRSVITPVIGPGTLLQINVLRGKLLAGRSLVVTHSG